MTFLSCTATGNEARAFQDSTSTTRDFGRRSGFTSKSLLRETRIPDCFLEEARRGRIWCELQVVCLLLDQGVSRPSVDYSREGHYSALKGVGFLVALCPVNSRNEVCSHETKSPRLGADEFGYKAR